MKDIVNPEKYSEILQLQQTLNHQLCDTYEANKAKGREHLASCLITCVEELIESLKHRGYQFGLCDYSGDANFENSEQTYSDGQQMGQGIVLHFHGFSVQASWEGKDKYGASL